jgi:beta-N-acetylhexosaminidase
MQKISELGHHFIVGVAGSTLTDLDKKILEELQPIGILFLKRNFLHGASYPEWLSAFDNLQKQIKAYTGREKMFFSIDHEGGRVHRPPAPITNFPYAINFKEKSFEVAKAMAIELKSIGINLSWAPCVDINSNPNNPVIGDRSFGTNPEDVSQYAGLFFRGLVENGMLACIKHFPGHGDTTKDSHFDLPSLDLSLEELEKRELKPFVDLINQGCPMVMSSHILFPKIDPNNPATLSRKILNDILRTKKGFNGVIVTDDLDMQAISSHYSEDYVVSAALSAGCELFIVARHPDGTSDKPLSMAHSMAKAIVNNSLLEKISEEAKSKIEYLLHNATGTYLPRELNKEVFLQHASLLN